MVRGDRANEPMGQGTRSVSSPLHRRGIDPPPTRSASVTTVLPVDCSTVLLVSPGGGVGALVQSVVTRLYTNRCAL